MRRLQFVKKLTCDKGFHKNVFKLQKSQVNIFADEMIKGKAFFFSKKKNLSENTNVDLPKDAKLETILKAVWNNPKVTAVCPDLVIRLTSLRGQVSRTIWESLGNVKNIFIFF